MSNATDQIMQDSSATIGVGSGSCAPRVRPARDPASLLRRLLSISPGSESLSSTPFLLLYASAFLSSWSDRMWEFASVLLVTRMYDDVSMLPAALFGLLTHVVTFILSPSIGRLVDLLDRLTFAKYVIGAQNLCVALSGAILAYVLWLLSPSGAGGVAPLFASPMGTVTATWNVNATVTATNLALASWWSFAGASAGLASLASADWLRAGAFLSSCALASLAVAFSGAADASVSKDWVPVLVTSMTPDSNGAASGIESSPRTAQSAQRSSSSAAGKSVFDDADCHRGDGDGLGEPDSPQSPDAPPSLPCSPGSPALSDAAEPPLSPRKSHRADAIRLRLASCNATMRRINLTCAIMAPISWGLLLSYVAPHTAALVLVLWNLISGLIEYMLRKVVYRRVGALKTCKDTSLSTGCEASEGKRNGKGSVADSFWKRSTDSLKVYASHPAMWASLGYASLYPSVINWGAMTTAYMQSAGFSPLVMAGGRGLAAFAGVVATLLFPTIVGKCGLKPTAVVSVYLFVLAVLPVSLAFLLRFGQMIDEFGAWTLFVCIAISRMFLWINDLAASQIVQETVPNQCIGAFSGVQTSIVEFGYLLSFLMVSLCSDPLYFSIPILLSFLFVVLSAVLYTVHSVIARRVSNHPHVATVEDGIPMIAGSSSE